MKHDKEYFEAYEYLVNRFNSSSIHEKEVASLIDNITRANTLETAIREVEKTLKELRSIQNCQKKLVIEKYNKIKELYDEDRN